MTTYVGATHAMPYGATTTTATLNTDILPYVKDAFDGCGLVQTSDTGQLVVGSATWPGAGGNIGYWIYRFADSVQGTYPIFLKVTLMRGFNSSGTGVVGFRFQIGTGSDGAGNLVNGSSTYVCSLLVNSTGSGTTNVYHMFSHGEGFFTMAFALGHILATTCTAAVCISRTRNNAGAFDGRGVTHFQQGTGNSTVGVTSMYMATVALPSAVSSGLTRNYALCPGVTEARILSNGDKVLYPHFFQWGDIESHWAHFTVYGPDFSISPTVFNAAPDGTSRQYVCFGSRVATTQGLGALAGGAIDWWACFRWE